MALTINREACFIVARHNGSVHRGVVIECLSSFVSRERMRQFSIIAQWFFRNDVDGSTYCRRAIQCRASTSHYFYPLYHIGRYLLQAVNALQG